MPDPVGGAIPAGWSGPIGGTPSAGTSASSTTPQPSPTPTPDPCEYEKQKFAKEQTAYAAADAKYTTALTTWITSVMAEIKRTEDELDKSGLTTTRRQYLEGKLVSKKKELENNKKRVEYQEPLSDWTDARERMETARGKLEECQKVKRSP